MPQDIVAVSRRFVSYMASLWVKSSRWMLSSDYRIEMNSKVGSKHVRELRYRMALFGLLPLLITMTVRDAKQRS